MGFYALYRLLWRPAIIALYVFLCGIIVLVVSSLDRAFPSLSGPGRLILLTMTLPSLAGFFVGQSVGEIQHTPLSWSLPRIRWRLVSSVCLTGAVIAVVTTCAYDWFGGTAPTIPILASCFLWYSLVFTIGTYEFIDARSIRIRKSAVLSITILILVFGVLSINRIADLYTSQPALCALVTLIGALLYLIHSFGVNAVRGKSLVSMPVFHRFTFGPYQTAKLAGRRDSRRRWKLTAPLTGPIDWILAGEYENFGRTRVGWLGVAVLNSSTVAVAAAGFVWILGEEQTLSTVVTVNLAFGMYFLSLYLQKGWLYPLSRVQLAGLTYWSSLLHNGFHCGIMFLGICVLDALTGILTEIDFARPILLMFVCNPVIQWVRLRHVQLKVSSYVILAFFLIGYSILNPIWLDWGPDISFAYEVAAIAGLVLLSQSLFRYKIEMYFEKGDLV